MKKVFNLSIILAVLAAAFTFSSCGNSEEKDINITVEVNPTTGVVTGKVEADAGIKTAILFLVSADGEQSLSFFSASDINKDGTFRIEDLEAGSYKLQITDKDGNIRSKNFTIAGEPGPNLNFNLTSFTAAVGDIYLYEYNGTPAGGFAITQVAADGAGFKVVLNNGTEATISYTGNSFLKTDFTTITGAQAAANLGADLLLYLDGTTKTIKAGQLATFSGTASTAQTTKFAKQ